jgi:SAM-dependent methyltransferase
MGIESGRRAGVTSDYQRNWRAYFDAVADQPPRETCLRALAAFVPAPAGAERLALDLACGEGRDTRAMLARDPSWRVVALDASGEGLSRLRASLPPGDAARVRTVEMTLEAVARDLPLALAPAGIARAPRFDLVNGSFALPFCDEAAFPHLWAFVRSALATGGRFAGQFFGDRDEWARVNPRRHVSRDEALALLDGLTLEHFDEVEKEGSDALGGMKHHHLFHIVARRD